MPLVRADRVNAVHRPIIEPVIQNRRAVVIILGQGDLAGFGSKDEFVILQGSLKAFFPIFDNEK